MRTDGVVGDEAHVSGWWAEQVFFPFCRSVFGVPVTDAGEQLQQLRAAPVRAGGPRRRWRQRMWSPHLEAGRSGVWAGSGDWGLPLPCSCLWGLPARLSISLRGTSHFRRRRLAWDGAQALCRSETLGPWRLMDAAESLPCVQALPGAPRGHVCRWQSQTSFGVSGPQSLTPNASSLELQRVSAAEPHSVTLTLRCARMRSFV